MFDLLACMLPQEQRGQQLVPEHDEAIGDALEHDDAFSDALGRDSAFGDALGDAFEQ